MSIKAEFKKRLGDFTLEISFSCGNETLALLGGSGCGKSMTLKCIAGIVKPDEGFISADGVTFFDSSARINLKPQERRTGFLFQNYALFPNMTTRQNIEAVFKHGAVRACRADNAARYAELVKKFYLEGLENHYPSQLSGGQQQRVALARIMASSPSVIMLDEPLSALDTFLRWKLERELAATLNEFCGTALYVSHSRDEVFRMCDSVCVINDGKSERVKSVRDFFHAPETLAAAILSGCKNISRVEYTDDNHIRAKEWGLTFTAAKETAYVGIRAHLIKIEHASETNAQVVSIDEDLFEHAINVLPDTAASTHGTIRVATDKEVSFAVGDRVKITIPEEAVMQLKA